MAHNMILSFMTLKRGADNSSEKEQKKGIWDFFWCIKSLRVLKVQRWKNK